MEAKLICTDVYARVFSDIDWYEFVLTSSEGGTIIQMREILRYQNSVVYHGTTDFEIGVRTIALQADFCHPLLLNRFYISKHNPGAGISDHYRQFTPKEGIITFSNTATLTYTDRRMNVTTQLLSPSCIEAVIEIHCYKRHDDV